MADDPLTPKADRAALSGTDQGNTVCTVAFADLAGAAALYQSLGDIRALSVITRAQVVLERQVYDHRGKVVKTVGEQMLSIFPEANAAAASAIAMQQSIEHFAAEAQVQLGLKVGLHSGALIEEQGDVFGDAVNTAARLVELADASQIITDGVTLSRMRSSFRKRAREIDRRRVKGKSSEIHIVEIGWRRRVGEPLTTERGTTLERSRTARMRLIVGGREVTIDGTRAHFTIGRDDSNDLPIPSTKASRQHARIEWRRDKFVLFDHSTNGTYVALEGEPEVLLKHESALLHGKGTLSIGEVASPSSQGLIQFECL